MQYRCDDDRSHGIRVYVNGRLARTEKAGRYAQSDSGFSITDDTYFNR